MAKRRKRGAGSIHLRKDGRWEGRVVIGYDDKNLPITKNVLAKTKTECAAKLNKLKESLAPPEPETPKNSTTFGEWMDFWYQNHSKPNLRPSTRQEYENAIYKHIIPALGAVPLEKLTTNDLQQFYTKLKSEGRLIRTGLYGAGVSNRTVWSCYTRCRTALDRAVKDGLIHTNPAEGCSLPPQNAKEMQILTKDELRRFLVQAKEEGYYELFLLELSTGMRRGEVLALQWDDLDPKTGELRIERQVNRINGELAISAPKTKSSSRTIILPPLLVDTLTEYKRRVNSRWMFPSPKKDDSPLDPATVRKRLQTILEHAKCKKVRFHDLRHVFSTMALENGMDVKTLSAVIGHVSASTTLNIYTHVTDAMRQSAADKIDRGIAKCEPVGKTDTAGEGVPVPGAGTRQRPAFEPYKGKIRKAGTGCVTQLNDHLWEGKFSPRWPDGKIHSRNVYAKTEQECEELLAKLIRQMRAEIAEAKQLVAEGRPCEAAMLANTKSARGMRQTMEMG